MVSRIYTDEAVNESVRKAELFAVHCRAFATILPRLSPLRDALVIAADDLDIYVAGFNVGEYSFDSFLGYVIYIADTLKKSGFDVDRLEAVNGGR